MDLSGEGADGGEGVDSVCFGLAGIDGDTFEFGVWALAFDLEV